MTQLESRTAVENDGPIGAYETRLDAGDKVNGEAAYAGDLHMFGLLHGRPVRSQLPHARIKGIDTSAALEVPGVRAVLVAADLPIPGHGGRTHEPLARTEVIFVGQPVALVVAETEAAAEDGAELVVVEYEELAPVMDMIAAMEPSSPLALAGSAAGEEAEAGMHGDAGKSAEVKEEQLSPNVVVRNRFTSGDVGSAFARCAAVAEGTFRTSWVHQAYMEPQTATAWPEGGGLVVKASTQATFFVRSMLSNVLGIPVEKIRVEAGTLGGGFGGKLGLIEPLVASAAMALGEPVQVTFTRSDEFAAGNPAPAIQYELKLGAAADGTFAALEARVIVDAGGFPDASPAALAGSRVGGPYTFGAWEIAGYGVRTNRPGSGAYRGPTAPQAAFALEQLVDEVADQLGMDPLEIRYKNCAERGDARLDGSPWPGIGVREALDVARAHPLWQRRDSLPDSEGIGLAAGIFPGAKMGASAHCRFDSDGGFTIVSGYVDMTGTDTVMAQIAAETLGVSTNDVRVTVADTGAAPQAGVSGGSMVTYCLGNAVQAAAVDARRQILSIAAQDLEVSEDDLVIRDGSVYPVGSPDRGVSLAAMGAKLAGFAAGHPPVEGRGSALPQELAPSAAVAIVHARVDRDSGQVELLDYVAIQDVGKTLNPGLCEGQMLGGAAQAIGFALYEAIEHDSDGQLRSGTFLDYALPRAENMPPIECIRVEVPAPFGPLGAKGIGESACAPGAGAVANAIARATGARLYELPMSPRRIWRALRAAS